MAADETLHPRLQRLAELVREREPDFAFASLGTPPWTPLAVPPARLRVALASTGGLHLVGEEPFTVLHDPRGDASFRVVPQEADEDALDLTPAYVDQRFTARDPETALPRRALAALVEEGSVGSAAPSHLSFCGGLVRPFPELPQSAARGAELLLADGVQACVLLATCPLCVQTICILARELEERGLSCVCLSLLPELSELVGAPRVLTVRFPYGAPCGDPGNDGLQRALLTEAVEFLETASEPGETRGSRHSWRGDAGES